MTYTATLAITLVVTFWSLLATRSSIAQSANTTSTTKPASDSSLPLADMSQEKEAIYQTKVRSIHTPILQEYLAELKALLATTVIATDSDLIKAEITRVEKQIVDGVMDLTPPQAVTISLASSKRNSIFTLEPREASTPSITNSAGDSMTPLGKSTWTLSKLPAGSYKLTFTYTCPKIPPSASLTCEFAGATYKHELRAESDATKEGTLRPLRIPFAVAADATLQPLTVSAEGGGDAPWFFIRRIVISRDADK